MTDVAAVTARIAREAAFLHEVRREVEGVIVGQRALLDGLLIGLLADGHVLLEGVPGLAKSLAVQSLATAVGGVFRRIQFTPDLLPSDLLGTQVYEPRTGAWTVREGPVFGNLVLADEINRAPAKVQSALLEAMQERQVTLAGETRALPSPFLVLATMNPIEHEGTYPLPEAQIDRFLLKIVVGYPDKEEEKAIVRGAWRARRRASDRPHRRVAGPGARRARAARRGPPRREGPHLRRRPRLRHAPPRRGGPRDADAADPLRRVAPRVDRARARGARARAFLDGRGFVTPHDVKAVGMDVLRHRVITTYEAEAEGVTSVDVIQRVFDAVKVP